MIWSSRHRSLGGRNDLHWSPPLHNRLPMDTRRRDCCEEAAEEKMSGCLMSSSSKKRNKSSPRRRRRLLLRRGGSSILGINSYAWAILLVSFYLMTDRTTAALYNKGLVRPRSASEAGVRRTIISESSHTLSAQSAAAASLSSASLESNIDLSTEFAGETTLIYNTYTDIQLVRVNGSSASVLHQETIAKDLLEATAIDYFYAKQLVCWADWSKEKIECMYMAANATTANATTTTKSSSSSTTSSSGGRRKEVVITNKNKAEGLAIDWYAENIYWTNSDSNRIEVITISGKYRKVLFWTELDQPRGIGLIPHRRVLVWTDWGETPKIERASMDGNATSRVILVTENIFWPNGLTVDLDTETIYWVDGKLHVLQAIQWDGTNRRTIVSSLPYPYSVTLLQPRVIFWTDWKLHSIQTLWRGEVKQLVYNTNSPIAVKVYDARLQPTIGENPCAKNNGNCSHLCLLSATEVQGFVCGCPTGVRLSTDSRCAERPQDMLFLLQRSQISKVSLDMVDYTSFPMTLGKIKYAIAIDYDPVEDTIYWSDGDTRSIMRARQEGVGEGNGPQQVEVIVTNIANADGLAIDWLARNLYWTNTGMDRIEVARLDGTSRRVLVNENLVEPRAIAVAPTLGWLFWSDWSDKMPKVERASLDGTERLVLVSSDIVWPNGIALDVNEQMVYWCDAKTDKIEMIRMDGSGRSVLINENLPHAFGLSLLGDYIYWSDWQRRSIDRAHKKKGTDRQVIVDQHPDLMGIRVARVKEVQGTSACQVNNGGCSHLCFTRPKDYVCLCPIEYELAADKKTCTIPRAFLFYSRSTTIGRISVQYNEGNYNDFVLPLKDIKEVHELDVDVRERRIYWTDPKSKSISRAFVNGSEAEKVVDAGLIAPVGLAVDWVSGNVYWTDTETKRIEVARLDGSSRKVLLWKGVEDPRHLVLDPQRGYMYWSEHQLDSIMRANMDGSELTKLVKKANNVGGLALDRELNRLYWTSQASGKIEWADCEVTGSGGKKGTVLVDLESKDLTALAVYEDHVYWADWNTGVERVHKLTGGNRSVVHQELTYVFSLVTFAERQQRIGEANHCSRNNGGCSHLCLPVPGEIGFKCVCPTHYILGSDEVSCVAPKNFLVFSQKNAFGRLVSSNSTADAPSAPLPIVGKNIKVIEYDPIGQNFFWIDGKTIRSSENGSKTSVIINVGSQPFDLAYDVIGKLLFWTCAHTNSINITRINGEQMGNIDTGDSAAPRNLAIDFQKRFLFWSDYEQQAIFRSKLDGSQRMMVVSELEGVTALAVDPQANILFYADGKRIERIDFNGRNKKIIVSINVNQVTSLAALQGVLYWLDEKMAVESVNYFGENRRQEMLRLKQITDIVAVRHVDAKQLRNHTCWSKRNLCSHLCVVNPFNSSEASASALDICACPQGLILLNDKVTCGMSPVCGPTFFMCGSSGLEDLSGAWHKDCIPASWRCDGQNDCADRSDEEGCPSCHADQFRCQSGDCIDKAFVCDGTTHCTGGDDEVDCCKSPQEFKCPKNNVCLPPENLCDGWENCADGADESPQICQANSRRVVPKVGASDKKTFIIVVVVLMLAAFFAAYIFQICRTRFMSNVIRTPDDQAAAPLSPVQNKTGRVSRFSSIQDVVWMSTLNSGGGGGGAARNGGVGSANSYDRNNITGASSSSTTKGSSTMGYPLNPPPSPATTATSTRCNSYRPYRHYKSINQGPPPTPCSTDVADESDSNYTSNQHHGSLYDTSDSYTMRAQLYGGGGEGMMMMQDESCPPSPNSRCSNNFSPLPPPPSPVPSSSFRGDRKKFFE